jgi:L-iditol 2-dehydrogenase
VIETRQAVLTGRETVEIVRRELDEPRRGQVLVRVTECGLCAGEVDQWRGTVEPNPDGIGHEWAGVVEQAGDGVTTVTAGDHVVSRMPGGFADLAVVPAIEALPIAPQTPFAAAAEPLGCVVNAIELTQPQIGDDVVIIGTGPMALLLVMLSVNHGARSVVVVGRRFEPLARALKLGATRVVNLTSESAQGAVAAATEGRMADVVYEATGAPEPLRQAGTLVRRGGKLAIVGYHQGGSRSLDLGRLNYQAVIPVNCHFRDERQIRWGMERGMRLVQSGRLDPSPLATNRYPLDQIDQAFRDAAARPDGFVKAVVVPSSVAPWPSPD